MIGILDSGVGGLTVARALMARLPGCDMRYFGDTARTPYGDKSREAISACASEGAGHLMRQGATLLVIACHTISALAADEIRQRYEVPVFDMVSVTAARALEGSEKGRFGVIGTRATVESGAYETCLRRLCETAKVFSQACPLIVPLVEAGYTHRPEAAMIIKKYLHPIKVRQMDTLIPGCTHYTAVENIIRRKIGRRVRVVDPSAAMADAVSSFLEAHPEAEARLRRLRSPVFEVSDVTPHWERTAQALFRQRIRLTHSAPVSSGG
ncbi:glutamate racemase [Desulfonema ishimotonii]|uniref:Glutamate racemase n=1 Tax=Desulfonema ishimotonii TaxID=45657 RepID=A0A401FQT2_9BACT|nr:glutamate racemase [Desulfonema ishimotonii]GBC59323.1 glutamate racemase [Desulfonema ishimotonii]